MRKFFKISFFVVLLLQVSTINVLVGVAQTPMQKQPEVLSVGLPDIYIDLSSKFREMGYTAENIISISRELVETVLQVYCDENPYGYTTEPPPNFDPANFTPFIEDSSTDEYHFGPQESIAPKESSQDTILLSESKACVTCVVWDYPGDTDSDLGWYMEHAATSHLYPHAENDGNYDLVFSELENDIATRDGIDTVLDYFFENYDNVDLYFLGHGSRAWVYIPLPPYGMYFYYYCPYDSIDEDTGYVILDNVFWEYELPSSNPLWDASPMRMVMFVTCRDWEFRQEALYPGGSTSHYRAFCGFPGVGQEKYAYYYMLKWCDLWYQSDGDSSSAAWSARAFAWGYETGGVNMSYADSGSAIWK
jgi:hypothetical protein